ncbi:hypothetical protein [Klebsiella aerogenes]|uniref:hypothetical protein n=1 Tax=Klebsiella aerogenes TaxID=548 RepID=UPI00049EB7DA|nr:hypothetical protein [Klebsiella aerogenes]ELI7173162.1 hypothetical protein [Klebsiella aerogenes]EMF0790025.1 hypothetical protein [Klebsiella aerogenes]KDF14292.1 hypothetical protein AF47_04763 [Klebsiella aerogenes MGH 61]RSW42362.1 hypothetical protein EGH44_25195 [Klebsiella aerogenes]
MKWKFPKIIPVLLAFVVIHSVNVKAIADSDGLSIENYEAIKDEASRGMASSQLVLDASMQSMLEAIIYFNVLAKIDTGRAFICPPEAMRGSDLRNLIDSFRNKHAEKIKKEDRVALVAIMALKEDYSCR